LQGSGGNVDAGALVVTVKNDSGATLDRFSAVGVSDVVIAYSTDNDEFKNHVKLKVKKPVTADLGRWLILEQPLKDQEYGTAILAGVTACQIDLKSTSDRFVDSQNANTTPASGGSGPGQILWVAGGVGTASATGVQWAVINLRGTGSAATGAKIKTAADANGVIIVNTWDGTHLGSVDISVLAATGKGKAGDVIFFTQATPGAGVNDAGGNPVQYIEIAIANSATAVTINSSGSAADTSTWSRQSNAAPLKITRFRYACDGSGNLLEFRRVETYDSQGRLIDVAGETT